MNSFSHISKDLAAFSQTINIISKIDNKLGKSLALDRANYKFQEVRNKIYDSLADITKTIENKKPKAKLTPIVRHSYIETEEKDYLTTYLDQQKKRDERYQVFQPSLSKTTKQQRFRKSKPTKNKTKHLYTYYGQPTIKHQHNKIPVKEPNEEQYKSGMYFLSNKYRKQDLKMNYIQEAMPKPTKNPIMRRNLQSIFVIKKQNDNTSIYDQFLSKEDFKKQDSNIFLTNDNCNLLYTNASEILEHKTAKLELSPSKSKQIDGFSLNISNFRLIQDEAYNVFRYQHIGKWSSITPILTSIQNLLKRCGISAARIKTKQLIKIQSLCKKIPDRLLIKCLSNSEQIQTILLKQRSQRVRSPQSAAQFIQNYWRYHRHLVPN